MLCGNLYRFFRRLCSGGLSPKQFACLVVCRCALIFLYAEAECSDVAYSCSVRIVAIEIRRSGLVCPIYFIVSLPFCAVESEFCVVEVIAGVGEISCLSVDMVDNIYTNLVTIFIGAVSRLGGDVCAELDRNQLR